jgi:mannose-6-phosphate isomerase-like protein (cupin superfamily)
MKFRDCERVVREGEFIVVPHGVEHCPVADDEVHIILIEPKSTLNTGNITNERTVAQLERI